jgi:hypothetical protein
MAAVLQYPAPLLEILELPGRSPSKFWVNIFCSTEEIKKIGLADNCTVAMLKHAVVVHTYFTWLGQG